MTDPMADWRTRVRLGWRIVRDRHFLHVPPGHPYSPIPSAGDLARAAPTEGPGSLDIPGVDLRQAQQWELLDELLPLYESTAEWLQARQDRLDNTWFAGADAVLYTLMLRHLRPARIVEVGCGYSSRLTVDAADQWLPGLDLTMIEPDPERVLSLIPEPVSLIATPVQDVDVTVFDGADLVAIDSSHVLRAGSDVQHLLFEVLPHLPAGTHLHVHDIFHPFEYPASWLRSGTALNEAYAWHALLQDSSRLRIVLWNHMLMRADRPWFERNMPLCLSAPFVTGGLWVTVR